MEHSGWRAVRDRDGFEERDAPRMGHPKLAGCKRSSHRLRYHLFSRRLRHRLLLWSLFSSSSSSSLWCILPIFMTDSS